MLIPVNGHGAQIGDRVDVGIRPENVALGTEGGLPFVINVLERLGEQPSVMGIQETHQKSSAPPYWAMRV